MSTEAFTLTGLLSPITPETFFSRYWEQQPLHVRRPRADYYEPLLTLPQLERLIESPEIRYPAVQLSKAGGYFPPEVFTEDVKFGADTFTGVLNLQKLNTEYRAGATVVLPALHRSWQPLADLCAGIESEICHVAHANAYLTPGNTAGFTPHYDTHEVLVLQISGTKCWRIYEPPMQLPHRRQPFTPVGYTLPEKPVLEINLQTGDLLYLPRGYVHTTETSDASSAHITVGIAVYTWVDLAGEIIQAAMGSSSLRRALPPGFAQRTDRTALTEELSRVLLALSSSANAAALVEAFVDRTQAKTPKDRGSFRSDIFVVQADTPLSAPEPQSYRIVPMGAKVAIEYRQHRFILPAHALPLLQAMHARRPFTAIELPAVSGIEVRLALVRTLVEKGFLTVVR